MKKETRSLLKMRAAALAAEPEKMRESSEITEIIEFTLASESYGIESAYVREVYPLKDFTPLPGVPSFILGIVNIRGQILPVIDLKKFFNLPVMGFGELNKVVILHNDLMEFGVLADEVIGMKEILLEDVLSVPSASIGIGEKYLKGITKNRLILLSAENLLSDKSIVVNEQVI
jgi:purine-binding chemotaxis protein CheW